MQNVVIDVEEGGLSSSLVFDPSGNPAVSYCGEGFLSSRQAECRPGGLRYVHFRGTSWDIESIDTEGYSDTSLAFHLSGNPCISYIAGAAYHDKHLKYAQFNGSSWDIETVDSIGVSGANSCLALDSDGNPGISYCCGDNLKFTYFNGISWHMEIVDSGNIGCTSLKFNSLENPVIAYGQEGELKYACFNGISWHIETVDSLKIIKEGVGAGNSLAFDRSGNSGIAYYRVAGVFSGEGELRYAHFNGISWDIEIVDDNVSRGGQKCSLAFDAKGHPAIAYVDSSGVDKLKYAHFNGISWDIETIDYARGCCGQSTSLAFTRRGEPAISYYGNELLKFATKSRRLIK